MYHFQYYLFVKLWIYYIIKNIRNSKQAKNRVVKGNQKAIWTKNFH